MTSESFTITKRFPEIPFAHRQPNHEGHCRLIHGHNWTFEFTFGCRELDKNGFVVDFGKLKSLKSILEHLFDHALVLNNGDFLGMGTEEDVHDAYAGLARVTYVPNCGAEGLAIYAHGIGSKVLSADHFNDVVDRGLRVLSVTVYEDQKNSATYIG